MNITRRRRRFLDPLAAHQGEFLPRLAPRRADLGQSLRKRERGIWQRRYWEHTLRDEDDFARHVDYIHFNPVKHGHVERVEDWPFSSFRRMVRRGLYPAHWAGGPEKLEDGFGER